MKCTTLAYLMLASAALLGAGPLVAQTYNYSVFGTTVANSGASLIQAQDARLYGTAIDRATHEGLVFDLTLAGRFNPDVYRLGALSEGGLPLGALIHLPLDSFGSGARARTRGSPRHPSVWP